MEEVIGERLLAATGSYPAVCRRPHAVTVRIESYLERPATVRRACKLLADWRPQIRKLPREDWAESWKKHFPLLHVGRRIVIKPSWNPYRAKTDEIVIELDPGMSFGTGHHATTRFCLQMIERLWFVHCRAAHPPGRLFSLLDVGTGSGILAIASAKLGYEPVLGVDNDAQAVRIAQQNARRNVAHQLRHRTLDLRMDSLDRLPARRKYPVVTANLLADLILQQRRRLVALVAPGGSLVLAGILASEAAVVRRAFRAMGLTTWACKTEGQWTGFVFRKPASRPTHSLRVF